jgi:hypothetical protein
MDIKKYEDAMRQQTNNDDTEAAHHLADEILCDVLNELGYKNLVDLFYKVDKWYA